MSDLAERIRELTTEWSKTPSRVVTASLDREITNLVINNAPTILAGLAALEVVNNLRVRLSAVQFNYASELGIQAESLMQLEQSLGESFESLGDAIASAVAALEERDKLRAALVLARGELAWWGRAYQDIAPASVLQTNIRIIAMIDEAAALQPTPETTKEK